MHLEYRAVDRWKRDRILHPKLYIGKDNLYSEYFQSFSPNKQCFSEKEVLSYNSLITKTLIRLYVLFGEDTLAGNNTRKCLILLLMKRLYYGVEGKIETKEFNRE